MIADKDKIFTNLHGKESPYLEAAKKRSDWDQTKSFILKGRDWVVEQIKNSGLRGR
jgi:NADH-quinone oxidoreductase subunit F